jgi:hypothetical protein
MSKLPRCRGRCRPSRRRVLASGPEVQECGGQRSSRSIVSVAANDQPPMSERRRFRSWSRAWVESNGMGDGPCFRRTIDRRPRAGSSANTYSSAPGSKQIDSREAGQMPWWLRQVRRISAPVISRVNGASLSWSAAKACDLSGDIVDNDDVALARDLLPDLGRESASLTDSRESLHRAQNVQIPSRPTTMKPKRRIVRLSRVSANEG